MQEEYYFLFVCFNDIWIKRDSGAPAEIEIEGADRTYYLRTDLVGVCGKVFQAAGAAIPLTVRNG